MIAVEDKIIGVDETQLFEGSLKASAERNKGDRPANLVLEFEGGKTTEQSFAGLRFDDESKQLMPLVEVGQWQDLVLVMGLRRWLIFKGSPPEPLANLDLHRGQDDDTGFYRVTFHDYNALLIAVYEGGVAAISAKGDVSWHRKKHWDDELLRIEDGRLIFLAETGEPFALDCASGNDVAAD